MNRAPTQEWPTLRHGWRTFARNAEPGSVVPAHRLCKKKSPPRPGPAGRKAGGCCYLVIR